MDIAEAQRTMKVGTYQVLVYEKLKAF